MQNNVRVLTKSVKFLSLQTFHLIHNQNQTRFQIQIFELL